MSKFVFTLALLFSIIRYIWGMQVIPERSAVTYMNEKYLHNATIYVKRYGRRSGYYINVEGTTLAQFGNNVSLHLVFYEYLHNEYRRSFVEMHFDSLCDMIHKDPYVGRALTKMGVICPVPEGTYRLMNISLPTEDFPNVWPFEKCKVEGYMQQHPTRDIIGRGYIYLLFKQKLKTG